MSVVLIFSLAFLVRVLSITDALTFDEFYHILAAQSWIERGTLAIADGSPYDRARLFTYVVAGSMRLFGETLVGARLPSVLFGALWVTLVFVWIRRIAGSTAGWVAALLLCFDPHAIGLSQIARMYAMHALFFWLGAAFLFEVVTGAGSRRRRIASAAAAAAALGLALHLQVTTVIGVAALAAWPVLRVLVKPIGENRRSRVRLAVAVGFGLVLGIVLLTMNVGAELLQRYHYSNARQALLDIDPRYYLWWLEATYPVLVALLPLAVLVAMRRNRFLTLYCASFFLVAFVLHSAAASRQVRYFHYALPALFIIWGVAAAELLPRVVKLADEAALSLSRAVRMMPVRVGRIGILAATVLFAVATSPSVSEALRLTVPGLARPTYGNNYWRIVQPQLDSLLTDDRIVVSTMIPQTLYFLDRGDVEVGLNFRPDPTAPEFADDWRFGVPVINRRSSLEAIVRCNASGLFVVHEPAWRRPWGANAQMADFAEKAMIPVALGDASEEVVAFRWDGPVADRDDDCASFRPPFEQPSTAAGS